MTSAEGATLTRLPDGSVLAGGRNPAVDTYTVEADDHPVRDHRDCGSRPSPTRACRTTAPAGIRTAATSTWTRSA